MDHHLFEGVENFIRKEMPDAAKHHVVVAMAPYVEAAQLFAEDDAERKSQSLCGVVKLTGVWTVSAIRCASSVFVVNSMRTFGGTSPPGGAWSQTKSQFTSALRRMECRYKSL
jgi:hypothetical protein